jgi:hypothetical protein
MSGCPDGGFLLGAVSVVGEGVCFPRLPDGQLIFKANIGMSCMLKICLLIIKRAGMLAMEDVLALAGHSTLAV